MNSPKIVEFADPKFGSVTDILGIILFVIGFLIESIADIHKVSDFFYSTLFLEFPIYRFDPESEGDLVKKDKNKNVGDKDKNVGDKNV
ncbi:17749_t:CDS:2 [Racocetra fulgida]|uniref:17749_t:CDS:1 n=1 Tax=Racocetra fulgida TaxID=60492 RepID=A0A9N8Z099_9GLOM|nr:17749_t:CDS:2 [Racocetra fulgida]